MSNVGGHRNGAHRIHLYILHDALTEAAVHRYELFGDSGKAFALLNEVRTRYKGSNAEDEATLWFARIASLNEDGTRAEEAWQALEHIAQSARVRRRMEHQELWLNRWQAEE